MGHFNSENQGVCQIVEETVDFQKKLNAGRFLEIPEGGHVKSSGNWRDWYLSRGCSKMFLSESPFRKDY